MKCTQCGNHGTLKTLLESNGTVLVLTMVALVTIFTVMSVVEVVKVFEGCK